MKVLILRSYEPLQTRGNLIVYEGADILFACKTLELPDKKNAKSVSCIPEGEYDCDLVTRPNKTKAFMVTKVPQRTAILFHPGSYATGKKIDTEGCILPGLRYSDINNDGNLDVTESTIAMNMLLSLLPKQFKLTIM